jgi:hypothetical protein
MVDESGPKPEIKREQEAFPPDLPDNPAKLEKQKRRVIGANIIWITAVIVIFIGVMIYFIA